MVSLNANKSHYVGFEHCTDQVKCPEVGLDLDFSNVFQTNKSFKPKNQSLRTCISKTTCPCSGSNPYASWKDQCGTWKNSPPVWSQISGAPLIHILSVFPWVFSRGTASSINRSSFTWRFGLKSEPSEIERWQRSVVLLWSSTCAASHWNHGPRTIKHSGIGIRYIGSNVIVCKLLGMQCQWNFDGKHAVLFESNTTRPDNGWKWNDAHFSQTVMADFMWLLSIEWGLSSNSWLHCLHSYANMVRFKRRKPCWESPNSWTITNPTTLGFMCDCSRCMIYQSDNNSINGRMTRLCWKRGPIVKWCTKKNRNSWMVGKLEVAP